MSKPQRRCQRCKAPIPFTVATNDHLYDRWGNIHKPERFIWGVAPSLDLTHGPTAVALDMFLEARAEKESA